MRPLIIIGIVVLALILGKIFFFSSEKDAKIAASATGGAKTASAVLPVDIFVAQQTVPEDKVYSSGTIMPNEEVELRSEVSGRLIKLNIKEGAYIQKGQLIAKLKDDDIKAQQRKLAYEENLAKQTEARQKKLLDINAISKEEYDIAVNKVNTLGADKDILEVALERTEIRAPFSGRIGLKNISEGAYITPTTIIATLLQTNPIKIDFTIPEKYSSEIRQGQKITFEIDGQQGVGTATILATEPKVDADLRTLKVRALATNPNGRLLPGMFVRVMFGLGSEPAIMIPSEAIVPILKGKKVFVKRNGKAQEVLVETGLRDEKNVQITQGLQVGDSVVTSALMNLKKDMPIKAK